MMFDQDIQSPKSMVLAKIQGWFYLLTGLWPVFEIDSFMWVTGPKTDLWLVRTVGLMIAATGAVLIQSSRRRSVSGPVALLAVLNAGALAAVDVYYSLSDVISNIYLLDSVVEIGLVFSWLILLRGKNRQAT